MDFWRNEQDLMGWIIHQKSPEIAAHKIIDIIGKGKENENEVIMTCKNIIDKNDNSSANILFRALAKYNLTTIKEGSNMKDKIIKEAQAVMRSDSLYGNLPMRICPKLPVTSAGQRLISTYNCRHYCLDSMVFDDDPERVYCAEALWRRHVMDKFSREFKDKDGKWVGGYINERFQVIQDDGGNQMQLAHGERSRKPRPHQYSTERRLSEARGEKTYDITASIESDGLIKTASGNVDQSDKKNVYSIFDDIVDMREAGLKEEDILIKVAEHYNSNIEDVAKIARIAKTQTIIHNGNQYIFEKKNSAVNSYPNRSTLISNQDVPISLLDGKKDVLPSKTEVIIDNTNALNPVFTTSNNVKFTIDPKEVPNLAHIFTTLESDGMPLIQEAADEVGLNEENQQPAPVATPAAPVEVTEEFEVQEK